MGNLHLVIRVCELILLCDTAATLTADFLQPNHLHHGIRQFNTAHIFCTKSALMSQQYRQYCQTSAH